MKKNNKLSFEIKKVNNKYDSFVLNSNSEKESLKQQIKT